MPEETPTAAAPFTDDPRERFAQAAASKMADDTPEEPLWSGAYSHLAMVGQWIGCGVLSVVAVLFGLIFVRSWGAWALLLGLVLATWVIVVGLYLYRRFSVHYRLSTQRLVHEAGLLWRTVDRVELIDVDDVTYRQGPVERFLGVGSIVISSSDRTTPELELPGIERVRDVADTIDDARRRERRSRGLHIESV